MFIREPAVAGQFYPGDPRELERELRRSLGPSVTAQKARAIVVPHAGWMYSGDIAAAAYREVEVPSTAVVLSPNHTGLGAQRAVICEGAFRLPTGSVAIAEGLAQRLRDRAGLTDDRRAHLREHAIEVHLPFLKARNPDVRIVPIVLGTLPFSECLEIGTALADVIAESPDEVLLVASTDMSHYISADEARRLDSLALSFVETLDARGLYASVVEHDISMCGFIPTTVVLVAARLLGAKTARLVRYGNSGDVSGDRDHVVGYASLVVGAS